MFYTVFFLPVQFLVNLGLDREVKHLELAHVSIADESAEVTFPPLTDPGSVSHSSSTNTLALDSLTLFHIWFDNSVAATHFTRFVAHMNAKKLRLAKITARSDAFYDYADEDDNSYHDEDADITKVIVSELKLPFVKLLELDVDCQIEHFQAALEVKVASALELDFLSISEWMIRRQKWSVSQSLSATRLNCLVS